MTKRKRNLRGEPVKETPTIGENKKIKSSSPLVDKLKITTPFTIQIVTGSYDGIIHGIIATISSNKTEFADTFLFTAHSSAIRCLAISPPPSTKQIQKIYLASGGTDERIHLYHLSAHTPSNIIAPSIPNILQNPIVENSHNRELGSLLHHSGAITAMYFPNRGKLLSSAEDRQISITRTRDWNVLCSIKSPAPKQTGRPSGDTAPMGGAPSGINDFAVHPSMKIMISVGKGERCMRLWNLVTGKKAGVLNFDASQLSQLGDDKYSSGEGRKVAWGSTEAGDEFCVGFERGLLVYGMDSRPRCIALPDKRTKIHQLYYLHVKKDYDVLAVSTEDGRIIFFSTRLTDLSACSDEDLKLNKLPSAKPLAQLGGNKVGISGRIKDFSILPVEESISKLLVVVTAESDGTIRLWQAQVNDLMSNTGKTEQIGMVVGVYKTNNRITCLKAFVLLPSEETTEDGDLEEKDSSDTNDNNSNSDNCD
ncbi:Protein MAK11 [Erysiphe neolycopersici]|uniref:Protein MAK11 n=1 Tax=Erysiphe neolycopersici TaxID=212602 RepID=A0A420HT81_9PEZI|nr:Protein MAK11 [Erysiphe neolycopersici]